MREILNNIKEHFILYTVLCYILSLLIEITYYANFNIPIVFYMTINEFLIDNFFYAFYIIIMTTFLLYFNIIGAKKSCIRKNKIRTEQKTVLKAQLEFFIFFNILVIGVAITLFYIESMSAFKHIFTIYSTIGLYWVIMFDSLALASRNRKRHESFPITTLLMIFLFILVLPMIKSEGVKLRPQTQISLSFDNNEIVSDATNIYIGETSSHVFLYGRISEVSTIIPKTDIKSIKYKILKYN